ncbi:uncharacterized protein [Coffea arabica]|uniref:Late blight resistance protein homolog R1A-3 n=1 Tax=Coffea arabica TaxID=13443 RepID=A0ABM4WGH4_COFAR|nr:uncharacterized protein LOC113723473 [Coffea arabica]
MGKCVSCIDLILGKLQWLVGEGYDGLNKLRVELGLVRTFLLCGRHSSSSLEDSVDKNGQRFYSLLLEDGLPPAGEVSCFRKVVHTFRDQIRDDYIRILEAMLHNLQGYKDSAGCMLRCYSAMLDRIVDRDCSWGSEFLDFFSSLLTNLDDILFRGEACNPGFATLLAPLHEKLKFLNGVLQGEIPDNIEHKKHCGFLAVYTAYLCFMCWFLRDYNEVSDWIKPNISISLEKISAFADQARLTYSGVWASRSFSKYIDLILDCCKDDCGLNELKIELRLAKTLILCQGFRCDETSHFAWIVAEKAKQFHSLLRRLDDGLARAASDFQQFLRQEISESYDKISDKFMSYVELDLCPSLAPFFWEDNFIEFSQSLLENLVDIAVWGEACDSRLETLLTPLQKKLVFFKNLILFARLHGKNQLELMKYCKTLVPFAAGLCYKCWFFREDNTVLDEMSSQIAKLIEKFESVVYQVRSILVCGSSSLTVSTKMHMIIAGEFVDSLLSNLLELLQHCPTRFLESLQHQMRILYDGLQFLRNILKKQQEKYDGLPGRIKCIIGVVVNDAGVVIFSLPQYNIPEALAKEIDIKLFCLLGKINTIKAAVDESYPVVPRFNFRTTNVLGIIDHLLDKLKELANYKVDPVSSFAKDRSDFLRSYLEKNVEHPTGCPELQPRNMQDLSFLRSFLENNLVQHKQNEKLQLQAMQDDLVFLRSFLERSREHPNYHEGLEALWSHVVKVAYKAEFVIDSLIVRDVSFYSLLLLDNVREEIVNLAQKATEMSKASNKRTIEALYQVPSEGGISTNNKAVVELKDEAQAKIDQLIGGSTHLDMVSIVGMPDPIAKGIKRVKSEAQEAAKSLRHLTPQEISKTSGASYQVSSSGSISTVDKAEVVLQDVEQAVIDKLIKGLKQLDVISIVGVAGLGKTFLAQRVYRDPRITSHFHIQAWSYISQTYCKKDLLLQILACIDQKTQFSEKDEYQLALELWQCLLRQRFLIVLDDVWDIEAWNALKSSFPEKNNGSRILLTSRLTDIVGKPCNLRTLSESESCELLQKKLAVIREGGYSQEQNLLGWKIAKTCNGMPLSIAIISGILATLGEAGWEEVAKMVSLTAMVGATEQCRRILKLSYRHLPDHLKRCILYFGAFREDQEICVRRLTWLWIAEGFVQKSESECLEKIAEGYIRALINRSLVMVGQRRYAGEVKTCRIHDLLHVFCVKKAKKQNFLQLVRGYDEDLTFDEPYNPRRLSIQAQPKHFIKSRIICPQIRSLLYSSRDFGVRQLRCNFRFIFLLKLLNVLDLENISLGSDFPRELWSLVQLRYLAVLGWLKNGIPSSLEMLSNLETFLVRTKDDVGLSLLQDTLLKMQKLRHLHVYGALIDIRLANDNLESSSLLNNLDTFSTMKLYLGQSMEKMIRKFPNIRQLKCCLVESAEFTADSNRVMVMNFLSHLESLKLNLGKVTMHCVELYLPSSLQKLTLEEFSWCIISTIGKLPNLQVLRLYRQADGEEKQDSQDMENSEEMEDMEEEIFFPKLKFLKLKSLKIVRWKGLGHCFPSLEKLVLDDCKKLQKLPSCLGESPLKLIEVHRCPNLDRNSFEGIEEQQMDYGNMDLKILISEEFEESSSWSDGDSDGWLPEEIDESSSWLEIQTDGQANDHLP